jgi:hypothetical protein
MSNYLWWRVFMTLTPFVEMQGSGVVLNLMEAANDGEWRMVA